MNNQEKLKILKSLQELILREYGRRIERADLLSLTTLARITVDFMFFLSNTAAITDSADKAVADMHETIHAGLDSLFTLRKVAREFPKKSGAREVAWPTCPDFARFRETFLTTFDKMTDVNIGAESRLGCLQELAGMELVFLGKTF